MAEHIAEIVPVTISLSGLIGCTLHAESPSIFLCAGYIGCISFKKSSKCHKTVEVSHDEANMRETSVSRESVNQTLEYKAFQDYLTFVNRHMIVWFSKISPICQIYWTERTVGHLVFWKLWPVTGHIATAKNRSCCFTVTSSLPRCVTFPLTYLFTDSVRPAVLVLEFQYPF